MAQKPHSAPQRPLKTLERVFSKHGIGSRTDARSWIGAGKVRVNGKVVQNPDHWVDLERDRITLDGKPLKTAVKLYILLHKPTGYLTTYRDPDGRPTVYDLVADAAAWLSPVGRLDLDTSGLLIMTNDTAFAERVMNPEHKVAKTYRLKASPKIGEDDMEQLRHGVQLDDGPTRPAEASRVQDTDECSLLDLSITEGRNRQVRRMLEAVGSKVLTLARTGIGPVRIGDLPVGKWRALTPREIAALGGQAVRDRGAAAPSGNTNESRRKPRPRSLSRKNPARWRS